MWIVWSGFFSYSSLAGEVTWERRNTVSFKALKIAVRDRGRRSSWGNYAILVLLSACVCRTIPSADTGLSFAWIPAWRGSWVTKLLQCREPSLHMLFLHLNCVPSAVVQWISGIPPEPLSSFCLWTTFSIVFSNFAASAVVQDLEACRQTATII